MIPTATSQLETTLVGQASEQVGRRLSSAELGMLLIHMIGERAKAGELNRMLPLLMRLALKANPYAQIAETLLEDHATVMRALAAQTMPQLIATIDACQALRLPVPVIVSCEAYLPKARYAQAVVKERYFGIDPIIVRGNGELIGETFDNSVLCLPVNDSYEALPTKMFETFVLLDALGASCGMLKLDDDLQPLAIAPLDLASLQATFAAAHYMGTSLTSVHHDRAWHFGKCQSPVPALYGKPFRAPWARGALYYVSGQALRTLSRQYLRFPGCIEGEIYEDKAVGDALHEAGIAVIHHPLELRLGISTDAPERTLVAAE